MRNRPAPAGNEMGLFEPLDLCYLPGQGFVDTQRTRQPEVPGHEGHEIAPTFALLRRADHGQCPTKV